MGNGTILLGMGALIGTLLFGVIYTQDGTARGNGITPPAQATVQEQYNGLDASEAADVERYRTACLCSEDVADCERRAERMAEYYRTH